MGNYSSSNGRSVPDSTRTRLGNKTSSPRSLSMALSGEASSSDTPSYARQTISSRLRAASVHPSPQCHSSTIPVSLGAPTPSDKQPSTSNADSASRSPTSNPQTSPTTPPLKSPVYLMPKVSGSCDSCHDGRVGVDSSEYWMIGREPYHDRPDIKSVPSPFPPDHPLLGRLVRPQPKCRLLALPLEVRERIHERVLSHPILFDLRKSAVKYTSRGACWIQACSQIYQESAEYFYKHTPLEIRAPVFDPTSGRGFFDERRAWNEVPKRLRRIGMEFLDQQRRRPDMTPQTVWMVWSLIGKIGDEANEELNDSWIEARDLIVDYFYWAHHYAGDITLEANYRWALEDGKVVEFFCDPRQEQEWSEGLVEGGNIMWEPTDKEAATMMRWNRQLTRWSHGQSTSTRVQRLWDRSAPTFPLLRP